MMIVLHKVGIMTNTIFKTLSALIGNFYKQFIIYYGYYLVIIKGHAFVGVKCISPRMLHL